MLYIAAFSMATDYESTKDHLLGWPGDLTRRKEDAGLSAAPYLQRLMRYEYLTKVDMAIILRKAGGVPWDMSGPLEPARHCPFKIYRITDDDAAAALFLATRNFTYGEGLQLAARPHGNKGFTVFRKRGDGAVFREQRAAQAPASSSLGLLPGQTVYENSRIERTDDYLAFN